MNEAFGNGEPPSSDIFDTLFFMTTYLVTYVPPPRLTTRKQNHASQKSNKPPPIWRWYKQPNVTDLLIVLYPRLGVQLRVQHQVFIPNTQFKNPEGEGMREKKWNDEKPTSPLCLKMKNQGTKD